GGRRAAAGPRGMGLLRAWPRCARHGHPPPLGCSPVAEGKGGGQMPARNGTGANPPLSHKVATVFEELRKAQLARATAGAFVQQALAYMKEHQVAASVAVDALLTPAVVRQAAPRLTGPL